MHRTWLMDIEYCNSVVHKQVHYPEFVPLVSCLSILGYNLHINFSALIEGNHTPLILIHANLLFNNTKSNCITLLDIEGQFNESVC
jgi:hypothetical protein